MGVCACDVGKGDGADVATFTIGSMRDAYAGLTIFL